MNIEEETVYYPELVNEVTEQVATRWLLWDQSTTVSYYRQGKLPPEKSFENFVLFKRLIRRIFFHKYGKIFLIFLVVSVYPVIINISLTLTGSVFVGTVWRNY